MCLFSKKTILICLAVLICMISFSKTVYFHTVVRTKSELYSSSVLSVKSAEEIYSKAGIIADEAKKQNCNFVVFETDSRLTGYATSAINYGKYIPYNGAIYDRRTEIYDFLLRTPVSGNVLFVSDVNDGLEFKTVCLQGENLLEYLRVKKSMQRYPLGDSRRI